MREMETTKGKVICSQCGATNDVTFFEEFTKDGKSVGIESAWLDCWKCCCIYLIKRKKRYE
jgi:hypothetical protein